MERILMSAIHYTDGKVYEDQPVNIENGIVICGRRHKNCIATAERFDNYNSDLTERVNQGFLTDLNRYVDRKEAFVIAARARQLLYPQFYNLSDPENELTSEDIFKLLPNEQL